MSGALERVVASMAIQRRPRLSLRITSVIVDRKKRRQPVKTASGAFVNRKPSRKSSRTPGDSRRR